MSIELIRDIADTSGYWAAVWALCPMPDVHVICDAPIGCFNLVGTAVPDYTDAIPHIENLTPSVMTEQEVGGSGTAGAVKKTIEGLRDTGVLEGKRLIVVSTAESEMIGADHGALVEQFHPGATFYYSNSLSEDEWAGRDRVLRWLWDTYGAPHAADVAVEPGTVNIIGPTYGCFNSPSDLHEIVRLVEAVGGKINLVYPYQSQLADTPKLARAAITIQLYKEFGYSLAERLGRPTLVAPLGLNETTAFIRELGRLLGTEERAERFIEQEKRTTLQALWDLWRGPQGDWFGTMDIGIVAGRSHAEGLARFLGEELGMRMSFVVGRPRRPGELDNDGVRRKIHARAPSVLFGSINEKIYLSEAGARATQFIPAGFPGAAVRRAVGTPYMGYAGAVYVVQELVNGLYEALFNFLPVDKAYAAQRAGATPQGEGKAGNLRWQPEARQQLDAALEQLPYIPRISASRELQFKIEALAHSGGHAEVTPALVQQALADQSSGR